MQRTSTIKDNKLLRFIMLIIVGIVTEKIYKNV